MEITKKKNKQKVLDKYDLEKERELQKELDLQHARLMNGGIETMSIEDFAKKHRNKYGI